MDIHGILLMIIFGSFAAISYMLATMYNSIHDIYESIDETTRQIAGYVADLEARIKELEENV